MYVNGGYTYYVGSEQRCKRGRFLLLLCYDGAMYGVVRKVALRQFGHFMMGSANVGGKWCTVSGAYGSDGLPMDVDKLPRDAVKVPGALVAAWDRGGGWNGAGSEGPAMREWARGLGSCF